MMEFMLLHAAIKNFKEMNAKSQDYDDQTNDEGIDNYFSYDQFNYTKPRQSNTRNYGYNSVDITKVETQRRTQRVIDIVSTIVICIPVVCLIIAFFYTKTQKVITIVSTVFIIAFICSVITYFYLYYM
jgi:hypothetical protein